jgi:Fic family protein
MSSVPPSISGKGWPPIGYEDRAWVSTVPAELLPRAVRDRARRPYRAAVVPVIATTTPNLPSDVSALASEASAEIARFDAELGAEVAPFAAILLRSESSSSSRIENLTSGAKAILLAEMGSGGRSNATEIVGNVRAMTAALELADRLDEHAILSMHAALLGGHDPSSAGRWRTEQVWIGGDGYGPHRASFIPPHHEQVPELIADLVSFAARTDVALLTQSSLAHAQFETIHPFTDGNGRTGRALIHAMLRGHGLTRNVTVPVSAGLLTDTGAYFDALTAYRGGDPVPIVERLANASFAAIENGRRLVAELKQIRTGWNDVVAARRDSAAWRLADLLIRQPVIDTTTVARELGIAPENSIRPITRLVEAGVLKEFTGMARNRMWQSQEVLDALDSFAGRAIRRR